MDLSLSYDGICSNILSMVIFLFYGSILGDSDGIDN